MNLQIAQVLGLNTDQKAAQVISQVGDSDNAFFAVLELSSDDAFTKGRLALNELSDFYFEAEGSPSEKLNAVYEQAKTKFEGLEFDVLLAAVSGKALYFIESGNVEIFLKRGSKISSLFPISTPSQLVSGFLEEGDKVFFATKNLTNFLKDDLERLLNLSAEVFEQDLTSRIGTADLEGDGMAGLFVEIETENQVAIENLDSESPKGSVEKEEVFSTSPKNYIGKVLEKLLMALSRLKSYMPKSGRGRLILAVALLILVAAGLLLRFKSLKDEQTQNQFTQAITQARDDFNAASSLATLNPLEAKNKLDQAKQKVDQALSLKPESEEAKNLKSEIEQNASSILQKSSVSEFPLFLDLNLIKENFSAQHVSLSAGKILLLDPSSKTLILVDVAKKTNEILAGSQALGDAVHASLNGSNAFVSSKDKGVLIVDTGSQKVTEVSKTDEEWGEILDLYGFAGNVYLLDILKNQIWKYLPTSDGYSSKRAYLTSQTSVDLAGSIRMQIESSIYVLKRDGQMLRFTKGQKDHFGYEGLDRGVKEPKSFFVSSDTENLYLLDSGNGRLLILTKTGSYKGQMEGEKFVTATDLVVDEVGKKIYLLDGSKIYSVDLK